MRRMDDVNKLPESLPVPVNDGACDHLPGMEVPPIQLPSTAGYAQDLSTLSGRTVVYIYPRTGRPDEPQIPGWDQIPGARGCTPESCAFRDHYQELTALGAGVFGLSTQTTDYQREAAERLQLPYPLLSDAGLQFTHALSLPTFEAGGMVLIKRITLILRDGRIEKVFYPVFPPDKAAEEVIGWLEANPL